MLKPIVGSPGTCLIAAGVCSVLALMATPVRAQDARADVAAQLKVVTDARAEAGFLPDTQAFGRATMLGVLEDGGSVYLELTLDAGREYHIEARCDTGCSNIDGRVLSPTFDPVAEDTLDNDAPKMTFKAPERAATIEPEGWNDPAKYLCLLMPLRLVD